MDSVNSKTVPHSLDAEKAVLGCILIDNNSLSSVLEYLSVDSFYDANHRIIFDAMLALYDNSLPIDSVNLSNQLKKTKDLDKVGGAYYITGLSQEAPSVSNSEQYSKIVREKQILRTIIETSVEMNQLAYDDHDEISEIVDYLIRAREY